MNWYKFALKNKTSGQAYWIDEKGKIIPVEHHNRYIYDNIHNINIISDEDIYFMVNEMDESKAKDYMVEKFNWIRAFRNVYFKMWISILCKNILDNSSLKRIEDFLFSIDPPHKMNIVIEDISGNRISFPWNYFINSGMSFSEFIQKEKGSSIKIY